MKRTCLIFLLFPMLAFSQMRERLKSTDLERYELKGKVMELIHKEYEPKYSTDSTYKLELYDILGPHNYKVEFNRAGYLIANTELRKEGDALIVGAIWKYKYDKLDRITQEKRISFQYSKDTVIWNYEYAGDTIINIKQLDNTYKVLYYTYRRNGNYEYLNQANADSSYLTRKLFLYDKYDRLTRFEDYANEDFIKELRLLTYKDTVSKTRFKEVEIRTEDNFIRHKEFEYNEKGDLMTMIVGNFASDRKSVNRYEYVYDKHANWTEKRHIGWNGKVSTVYKREIKYYQ